MLRVLLLIAAGLFKLWMLIDLGKRRAGQHWFFIILFPFGAWAYFFMVKSRDPKMRRFFEQFSFGTPPASIERLRQQAEETPSMENRIFYGQGLHDAERYKEARVVFEKVLAQFENEEQALYGLGLCESQMGLWDEAAEHLGTVVEIDPNHDNNRVWIKFAKAQWKSGQRADALKTLALLVRRYPRIEHSVCYAGYLNEDGETEKASEVLRESLHDFKTAPKFVRKNSTRYARQAQNMLASFSQQR